MNILTVEHLSKRYPKVQALKDVSFNVPEGSVFGILGPNGSGKTTLLGIIMDIIKADTGGYRLFEDNLTPANQLRQRIGTLLETPNFYTYLSAYENLRIATLIKGTDPEEIDVVLRKVGLYERRFSKFSSYSLGMKQRLGIASALLGNPQVLILDEPTNGLDPEGIAEIRNLIKELGASGHTIIMASHLLDEVEKVCSHVAILKSGKLLSVGSTEDITSEGDIVELSAEDIERLQHLLRESYPGERTAVEGDTVTVYFTGHADTARINAKCYENGIILTKLVLKKKSMENIFLEVISNNKG